MIAPVPLVDWSDIADEFADAALLVGNGLSRCVSEGFAYESLHEAAVDSGALQDAERALFAAFETEHFEVLLSKLNTARLVARTIGGDTTDIEAHYRAVQEALAVAVHSVHPPYGEIETEALLELFAVLEESSAVFTTSYDLLLYWATAEAGYGDTRDLFWGGQTRDAFDPDWCSVARHHVPIYYLHGALHLVVGADGVTHKRRHGLRGNLLDTFGELKPGERTLFVSEGSDLDKRRQILGNDYLRHCHEQLSLWPDEMVLFGFSCSKQDRHITRRLCAQAERPIAVGMRDSSAHELLVKQVAFRKALPNQKITFYDASTHPLALAFAPA